MDKIKIICPHCGKSLLAAERFRGRKLKCPHCKHSVPVPEIPTPGATKLKPRRKKRKLWAAASVLFVVLLVALAGAMVISPVKIHWPDRRPIGVLFLASDAHTSPPNPRGWFNDKTFDVTGTNGRQHFRQALMDYTDRSLAILKRTHAQGVIVWDLEGEQFPHKTTFIGDPRQLDRLAPEMAAVVDEFFARLTNAGLRVGVTIRPQELDFGDGGIPRQGFAFNLKRVLEAKMDYARKRWGATLFYVDSNDGFWRPDEIFQLRRLAAERPDVLLIPEHHWLPYRGFAAPYVALRKGVAVMPSRLTRKLFPRSFQAIDISDAADNWAGISAAQADGNILLFRAWNEGPEVQLLEKFAKDPH